MTLTMYILYVALLAITFAFVGVYLKKEARRYNEFDLVARSLLREIDEEADKKHMDAEQMVINALKRVKDDIRSI